MGIKVKEIILKYFTIEESAEDPTRTLEKYILRRYTDKCC